MASKVERVNGTALRSAAVSRLIEAHQDEYDRYITEAYAARGLTYQRKLTEDERTDLLRRRKADRLREQIAAQQKALAELEGVTEADGAEPVEQP